jgi:hypothetical protein
LTPRHKPKVPVPRLDLNAVLGCQFGGYPWDHWHRWALARGLDEGLAGLGRLLIREAFNHDWAGWLKAGCGWSDDGQALLAYGLRFPKAARRRWEILMRTDGLRGDRPPLPRLRRAGHPRSTQWTWGFLKADARRLAATLQRL